MAIVTYRGCPACGVFELNLPMKNRPLVVCCITEATRAFDIDLQTLRVSSDDDIRRAYLKSDFESNIADQNRRPDPLMPRDKFEAKEVHRRTGRVYFGDDRSKLTAKAQGALQKGDRKEFAYQNGGGLGDD